MQVIDAGPSTITPGPNAPWVNGRWRLPSRPISTQRPSPCGGGTPLTNRWPFGGGRRLCRTGDSFFVDTQGEIYRLDETFSNATLVVGSLVGGLGRVVCTPSGLFTAFSTVPPDRNDAIVRFDDPDDDGRVLWATQRGTPSHPASAGGFYEFAATDSLIAWVHVGTQGPLHFYVTDASGRNPRDIAGRVPDLPYHLHADGDRLVFVAGRDLWLYTGATGALENLTHDRAAQWEPFLSGDRLVWMDQRDNPGADDWSPNNPEVYYMNLRDRVPIRITHDPPERPVVQTEPSVRGDWIVWNDLRHSHTPNHRDPLYTSEIYAYHLGIQREFPIATGSHPMGAPVIFDDQVYFLCSTIIYRDAAPTTFDSGLYRTALPSTMGAP